MQKRWKLSVPLPDPSANPSVLLLDHKVLQRGLKIQKRSRKIRRGDAGSANLSLLEAGQRFDGNDANGGSRIDDPGTHSIKR